MDFPRKKISCFIIQQFKETLNNPMFNIESTKEFMNILFLSNLVFHMWDIIFVEWENCNILDNNGKVLTFPPTPIGKLTFACLSNMKEKQLEKLT